MTTTFVRAGPQRTAAESVMSLKTLRCRVLDALRGWFTLAEGTDVTDYLGRLEREFDIKFTPDEVERLHTLGDMTALIARKLGEAGRPSPGHEVWPVVRRITAEEMGVAKTELGESVRFVEDLCC